jgi:hypothetical protein
MISSADLKALISLAIWASALSVPAWLFREDYHRLLAGIATAVLVACGQNVTLETIEMLAPLDLALFIALCIATPLTRWDLKARAMIFGALGLLTLDCLVALAGVVLIGYQLAQGPLTLADRVFRGTVAILPTAAACGLWIAVMNPLIAMSDFGSMPRRQRRSRLLAR